MLRRNLVAAVLRQGPSIQRLGRAVASTHSVYVWGTGPPSTPVGPLETVNPFWSTNIQQAAKGEGHVRLAAQSSGHPQQSLGVGGFVTRRNSLHGSSKRCRMVTRPHLLQCAVLEENTNVITKEEINRRLEEDRLRHLQGCNRRTMDLCSNLP